MLGRLVNSVLSKSNYAYVWGDTIDIIRNADISLINLECVIASTGTEWNKTFKLFHFRSHPEAIEVLKAASIDYVSLANNHTLDYDIEALIEMLNLLDKNKIAHSGAGRDLNEAMKDATRQAIEFLNYKLHMDRATALAYLSAGADFQVTQVVDRTKGVNAMIRKSDFVPERRK